jgi:ATP-dependent Clp protease protease subunit
MSIEAAKNWRDYLWEATRKTRTLLFSTDVSGRSVRDTMDRLLALEADDAERPITLLLNTPGGSVSDGYALVDMLRFIQSPVRVVGMGVVASMGISILLSVEKPYRVCLPNTRFMLHQPRFLGTVTGQVSDLEITASEMVKMKNKSNEEVAAGTGQPLAKVEKDTRRDLWLTADEALEYGLISRIIQSATELD